MGKVAFTITRTSVVIFCCAAGIYMGPQLLNSTYSSLWGGTGGVILALVVILLEIGIKRASGKGIIGGIIGLMTAFLLTHLATKIFFLPSWKEPYLLPLAYALTGYIGIMIGVR